MTTAPSRGKRRPVLLIICIGVVLLLLASAAVVAVTHFAGQQRKESLALLKDDRLTALVDARSKLQPAADAYFAAYKKARNAPSSREDAEQSSAKEREKFQQAADSARTALKGLKADDEVSQGDINVAAAQLEGSYLGFVDFMEGMVDSYAQFEGLFRDDGGDCNDLFVGSKASSLRERQTLLGQAATPCLEAANELKQSKNVIYVEFARAFNNRVVQLQANAEVTAKSEENYTEFEKLKDQLVQKVDEATAKGASDDELLKLADEAKALNTKIDNSKSEFDFAAKRYLAGVKDMPVLVGDVFSKNIAAEIKRYDAVIPIRVQVLKDVVDAELSE